MVQPVDRTFRTARAPGNLQRRETGEVAQHEHLALILGELRERFAQISHPTGTDLVAVADISRPYVFHGNHALVTEMVDRQVACHPQDPREERDLSLLVFADDANELRKDLLCHVFSLM
jgi:hypothetical protein